MRITGMPSQDGPTQACDRVGGGPALLVVVCPFIVRSTINRSAGALLAACLADRFTDTRACDCYNGHVGLWRQFGALTPPHLAQQIDRARSATLLLQAGVSIRDTMQQAGYYDQSHLTRSLKRFIGQTPAQLLHHSGPEQLSLLYKTNPNS